FYKPLTRNEIGKIIDLFLKGLSDRLKEKNISLHVTEAAKDYIVKNGYDPVYGARPIKRFIQSNIETLIARKMIENDIEPDSTVTVDYKNGAFTAE
ncbi:MAG TPA: type VI secretion system ATPase TssH, partial [Ruminococcaceae bacterium]|nr:type VI secretion system ATPase TssH [Oscillospiraceae bacterium]